KVTFDGPDDDMNPHNWTSKRKWTAAAVVAMYSTIAPMSSSMLTPSLDSITTEFQLDNSIASQIVFSIYVLAWGMGPMILGPLSEMYGRVIVLQIGNAVFVLFSIACGLSQNVVQLILFRFVSGLAGSAALAIDDGLLADMWSPDELGSVVSLYSFGPLLGPAIGPIAGGFITQYSTWRWSFFALAIASGVIGIAGIFTLKETYGPRLLRLKAKHLRKQRQDDRFHVGTQGLPPSLPQAVFEGLVRPLKMACTQPIIAALSLLLAYIWGVLYLLLSTFSQLWTVQYHESISIGSINYISLAIGLYLGTHIGAVASDKLMRLNIQIYKYYKDRNGGVGSPEFRAPLMIIFAPLVPIGCLWYGWSAQERAHWILPNLGVAVFGIGGIITYQGVQTYILEAYPRYGASAMASTTICRSIAGFVFPIFAPAMYQRLGYGWGNTLVAGIAILLGLPAPVLLYKYGSKLRGKSAYSAGE
ncbi:unnamed protein product, partial [Aureobasidium pullulans]